MKTRKVMIKGKFLMTWKPQSVSTWQPETQQLIQMTPFNRSNSAENPQWQDIWLILPCAWSVHRTWRSHRCWLTFPDDLMPLMSAAPTITELSSRQRAKCQTTGPVSSSPPDLCRVTRLGRRDTRLYSLGFDEREHLCLFSSVCVSYSQYCSLGLCTGTVIMLDGAHVMFSWVQLATRTPLTLQYTIEKKGKSTLHYSVCQL